MAKNFLFVCGDLGGTKMMIPVAQELTTLGHSVRFVADGEGIGYQALLEARINFEVQFESVSGLYHVPADEADLVFVSTCASTNKVEKSYARAFHGVVPVVFGSDGFFNHGYKWRDDVADFWFTINESHAEAIRALRPQLDPSRVKVVGQPAFDFCLELVSYNDQIQRKTRSELGISEEESVFLWWSQGMPEVIDEDVEMIQAAIQSMAIVSTHPVFIPRIHQKLDRLRNGFVAEVGRVIIDCCERAGVRLVRADKVQNEHLCLSADAILSITATDDIKNWLMGGPPVIHLMGPRVRRWFEEDLLLSPPDYLPDVQSGEALAVTSNDEWEQVLRQVLDPNTHKKLREKWLPPTEKATKRVTSILLELAS